MIIIAGYKFSDPWRIDGQPSINRAGIYAIIIKGLELGKWPILYTGQSGRVGTRFDGTHHKRKCWEDEANGKTLYACFYPMPTDQYSEDDRCRVEDFLIQKTNPPCNA